MIILVIMRYNVDVIQGTVAWTVGLLLPAMASPQWREIQHTGGNCTQQLKEECLKTV